MTTNITCRALNCIFNEAKRCISVAIIYDPAEGCLTYETTEDDIFDREGDEAEWEENDLLFGDDDDGLRWEDDDLWAAEDEAELTADLAENEGRPGLKPPVQDGIGDAGMCADRRTDPPGGKWLNPYPARPFFWPEFRFWDLPRKSETRQGGVPINQKT